MVKTYRLCGVKTEHDVHTWWVGGESGYTAYCLGRDKENAVTVYAPEKVLPINRCFLKNPHGSHDWWYISEGGGHMIDPEHITKDERDRGKVKEHHCNGLTKTEADALKISDNASFGVKAMRWGEKKPYQEPCLENTRENYEPTFILFNRNKGEKRHFSSVTFKSDYRERGSGSTDGDDFIAAYDKAIEMAEKRGYEKAKAEALEFITNSAKQYFKE
jgi:hypothetical protein